MWWFVPAENVKRIILSSPNKSCHSYPTPTDIAKECIDELLPAISSMVNLSLDTGQIQDIWKEALVRSTEKDYRAVSKSDICLQSDRKSSGSAIIPPHVFLSTVFWVSVSVLKVSRYGNFSATCVKWNTDECERTTRHFASVPWSQRRFWHDRPSMARIKASV